MRTHYGGSAKGPHGVGEGNEMARDKLTQRVVDAATCPADKKDRLMFDRDLPGFGVRIGRNGVKTFLAQYSTAAGKRRVPLGAFGVVTVEEARKTARAVLGEAAGGRDPFAERRAAAMTQKAAEITAKARAREEAFTVVMLVEGWQAAREGDRRSSYLRIAVAAIKRHFAAWLDRPAASITTAEAFRELDRIKGEIGPTAANRCLSYSRAAYGWAVKRQMLTAGL